MTPLAVLSAGSTLHALRRCAADFTRESGIALALATDHGHVIAAQVRRGEAAADIVAVPADMADALIREGFATAEVQAALGSVNIAAAVRADAPLPDIATMDGLRAALAAASSVLVTRAPTGEHMLRVIARLGLADTLAARISHFDTATLLIERIARSEPGALGFAPSAEILVWETRGVAYAGAVPEAVQVALPYAAAMLACTQAAESARVFLAFLATPRARDIFRAAGVV